jgi:hypothetical protein
LAGYVRDISVFPVAIAKCSAQAGHVDPEVARVYHQTAPDARGQFPMADDLTRAFDQHHQNV